MKNETVIYGINGPVVTVKAAQSFSMMEMVYVGKERLVGEVIGITSDFTTIQVYEETTGLRPGEPVVGTGSPMNVTLGPASWKIFLTASSVRSRISPKKTARSSPRASMWTAWIWPAVGCDRHRQARRQRFGRHRHRDLPGDAASSPTKAWCPRIFPASLPGPLKTANIP